MTFHHWVGLSVKFNLPLLFSLIKSTAAGVLKIHSPFLAASKSSCIVRILIEERQFYEHHNRTATSWVSAISAKKLPIINRVTTQYGPSPACFNSRSYSFALFYRLRVPSNGSCSRPISPFLLLLLLLMVTCCREYSSDDCRRGKRNKQDPKPVSADYCCAHGSSRSCLLGAVPGMSEHFPKPLQHHVE